eukprot:CAMPEP_0114534996 /NCGR_PEP_ID=MMETSP0109-20121206/28158_1 /TAXON_ID=29199 /ORGANISM="Chlorarachnion reptans, Strain CCCM449" /LENGTH=148 /DNA_ID=CAMNT_0001718487 /DNA_START=121 /DNA_END=567 /DNA_ORIENTATION=+
MASIIRAGRRIFVPALKRAPVELPRTLLGTDRSWHQVIGGEDTNGGMSMNVEGTFKAVVEEAVLDVVAGDCAFIPPGVVHGWCNVGETPGKLLFGFTPSVKGHKLTTVFEKIPEMDRKTLEDEYDVVVVAPPLTPDSPFLETGYKPED